jgi:3-oxoadipate enol-lactonase
MPTVSLSPLEVHYQQTGVGEDVVLIHAFTSNVAVWLFGGVYADLATDHRVTAYDLRGHGATTVTEGGYSCDVLADDLKRLVQSLGLRRPLLVGHSFGGVIAMRLAIDWPELVRGIVLSDTYFPALRALEPAMGQTDVWVHLRQTLSKVGTEIGPTVDFARLFAEVAKWTDGQRSQLRAELGPVGERWLSGLERLAKTHAGDQMWEIGGLTEQAIGSVRIPVLALYDEHSPFGRTSEYLARGLHDCRVAIIPEARHLAPLENPTALTEQIRQFDQSLCRSSPSC